MRLFPYMLHIRHFSMFFHSPCERKFHIHEYACIFTESRDTRNSYFSAVLGKNDISRAEHWIKEQRHVTRKARLRDELRQKENETSRECVSQWRGSIGIWHQQWVYARRCSPEIQPESQNNLWGGNHFSQTQNTSFWSSFIHLCSL